MRFGRVAVIGVGLIGGSFALALKKAGAASHIVGVGRSEQNLGLALERGIIDEAERDAARAAASADLVLVASPVAQFPEIFARIGGVLKPEAVLTDGGSTKRDVVRAAREALGPRVAQFVPAHPIAGAEKSGAAAATAELFRDRRVILTPLPENGEAAVARVREAWSACGARLSVMNPEDHDAVLAAVSHLPHVLAYALVHDIARRGNAAELFGLAAGGFRDFTRIASSHPEMWRDICLANRDRILEETKRFRAALSDVEALIEAGQGEALEKLFAGAREARDAWIRSS